MVDNASKPEAKLEDVMAAMDVVDTLRHEQGIVERELDAQGRRARLLVRLRELYQAQGIDVSDQILEEGIDALEQERFEYKPIEQSLQTRLAHIWVSRHRWGKPVGFIIALCVVFYLIYYVLEVYPQSRAQAQLPTQIQLYLNQVQSDAVSSEVLAQAQAQASAANSAISNENYTDARSLLNQLASTSNRLKAEYEIRVVSRPNENSGVWRIPPNNPDGRNFYIIVEAFDYNNKVVSVDVLNEENNKREHVDVWGIRVSEDIFYTIAADKQDDGIIQNNVVGQKKRGYLEPSYSINTSGSTITEW